MSISELPANSLPATDNFGQPPIVLNFQPLYQMTRDEYFQFAVQNRKVRIERNTSGEIVITSSSGGERSIRNSYITAQLHTWAKKHGGGKTFDSNGEFELPNGAARCPDASWVRIDRWEALSKEDRKKFPPLCPDFVIELRSESDHLKQLQKKLEEYLSCGAQLGWLIDPVNKTVHIYRPNSGAEILNNPASVSGEPVLPGFVLEMADIFG